MIPKHESSCKKVTIIGDTSKFHLGTELNYSEFRKLVRKKYNILQEIPYDAFGTHYIRFQAFFDKLKRSSWWKGVESSDILIVHGEGLVEKWDEYVYPYLYFSRVSREIGAESWLVNFSMYEGGPFLDFLKEFSYMACRDVITQRHLLELGLDMELSFDCCILGQGIEDYINHNGSVAVIRGRNALDKRILKQFKNAIRYNCSWQWNDENAVSLPTIQDYAKEIKKSRFTLSTSFHGNIISYLSGVPFVSLDDKNKKYLALNMELLPNQGEGIILENYREWSTNENRKRVYDYFVSIYGILRKRALLNCI